MFTKTNHGTGVANSNGKKVKAYRNRPSKRQAALELLSFLLILAGSPAFLGGVISIFIAWFTLALGLIGLFAWTRRHAFIFVILSFCIIALSVVNIILRATWNAQCLPFYNYNGVLNNGNENGNNGNAVNNINNNGGDPITTNAENNRYNNSIWCGNDKVVYITNAIIIALALAAHVVALSLLFRRKTVTPAYNGTTTTRTVETKSYATA